MGRKVIAFWLCMAMILGLFVIVDVTRDITLNVGGTTIYVNETGSGGAYTSIQDAINASIDGDTVFVYNGTYNESVNVNKTIGLIGEDKNSTIINGGVYGDGLNIVADFVNVTGFNIINCSYGTDIAGIRVLSSWNNIWNNNISKNGDYGIFIADNSNNNTIKSNLFLKNYETICLSHFSKNNKIMDNNITDNFRGIILINSSSNNISGNVISMSKREGMIFTNSSNNTIMGNNISRSTEYGILLSRSEHNDFTNNNFFYDGIFIDGDKLSHFDSHKIEENNMVNEKPLYYYKNVNGFDIDNIPVGQLILVNCSNINVKNLVINNTDVGMEICYSSNLRITNNTVTGNYHGIFLFSSSMNNITNSNTSDNLYGIYLFTSKGNIVEKNNVLNNDRGIYLSTSNNNTIAENNATDNIDFGVYLTTSENNEVRNNNVSYAYIGIKLFLSHNNTVIANNGSENEDGISIAGGMYNNIIGNNISSSARDGIILTGGKYNNIFENNVSDSIYWGIHLIQSSYNYVKGNYAFYHNNGIWLATFSNNNVVEENKAWNNRHGIYLSASSNNLIINNSVISNEWYGVLISESQDNDVRQNNISLNDCGILFSTATRNRIVNNTIWNNTKGISVSWSSFNKIYHNSFINNTNQASDTEDDNFWDNGYPSGGNYWSDYVGEDNFNGPLQGIPGSDGIGDTNYSLPLFAVDNYPLMGPYTNRTFENYTILKQGWNLISIPLIQEDKNLPKVLEIIDGAYDAVQWQDPKDTYDPWKHHKVGKSIGNDLFELNETMGFWIHITQPWDTIFQYNGTQLTSNQTITLHPGWNMVGYPSLTSYNRTEGLNNLTFNDQVDAIWYYDATMQKWEEMGELDYFQIGKGYYIHAKSECEWEVPL